MQHDDDRRGSTRSQVTNDLATTTVRYEEDLEDGPGYADGTARLTVGPANGSYPDQQTRRGYRVEFVDVDPPEWIRVDGRPLDADEWEYDVGSKRLKVDVAPSPVVTDTTVAYETADDADGVHEN